MDKCIIDILTKFGLITNIGIDADKYDSVDDLIAKGVITIPGSRAKIESLLNGLTDIKNAFDDASTTTTQPIVEVLNDPAPVIDETPVTETPLVDTPEDVTPIDETPVEVETVVCDDPAEAEVTIVETTEEQPVKKSKKNTKKDA